MLVDVDVSVPVKVYWRDGVAWAESPRHKACAQLPSEAMERLLSQLRTESTLAVAKHLGLQLPIGGKAKTFGVVQCLTVDNG
jgi:hypothetical protein